MPSVPRVREWLRWLAFTVLLGGSLGALEPIRIGLVGPEGGDQLAWIFFEMGMREAAAVYADDSFELSIVRSNVGKQTGVGAALERLLAQDVSSLVVMRPEAAEMETADLPSGVPIYWIEWFPRGVNGETWSVDWGAWARALQVVGADLANAPEGAVIGLNRLEAMIPLVGIEALAGSEAWPSTGAWSMQPVPDAIGPDLRGKIEVLITADLRVLMPVVPERQGKIVAVWLDALVLQGIQRGVAEAAVVPHWGEAGGQVLDRIIAQRKGALPQGPAHHPMGPLIVAPENLSAWLDFWVQWQF